MAKKTPKAPVKPKPKKDRNTRKDGTPRQAGIGQGKGGGAPEGSANAEKFKTPEDRRKAYVAYLDHIAAGFSGKSFFEPCLEETIISMVKKYPDELPDEFIRMSRARGLKVWEEIGLKLSQGILKGNPLAWKFNMQNRYAWKDRSETGFDKDTRAVFKLRMGKDLGAKPAEDADE